MLACKEQASCLKLPSTYANDINNNIEAIQGCICMWANIPFACLCSLQHLTLMSIAVRFVRMQAATEGSFLQHQAGKCIAIMLAKHLQLKRLSHTTKNLSSTNWQYIFSRDTPQILSEDICNNHIQQQNYLA